QVGDRHAAIDDHPGTLDAVLELSARQEAEGQGDAPWPPHYRKQTGEPARVAPSRRRASPSPEPSSSEKPRPNRSRRTRQSKHPLVEIARARQKEDALAGFDRWKARHPDAAPHLE